MKNGADDLVNILFEQTETLIDTDLTGDKLDEQLKRAKAINELTKNITDIYRLKLDAAKEMNNSMSANPYIPKMLTDE